MKVIGLVLLFPLLFLTGCWGGELIDEQNQDILFQKGKGVIRFDYYKPLSHKPVNIHYYIPEGNSKEMPVLFLLPGINRNAEDYLQAWEKYAINKKVMIFSLEFSSAMYSSEEYIEGGMFKNNTLKPEEEWTFSIIEPIFEFICKDLSGTQKTYDLWGHSAGAQFVHRYLMFKPQAHVNRAVSANAGWYTLPDIDTEFPYGLKNTLITADVLPDLLSKSLIVQLGTADTDENDPNLNHTPGADAQGKNRYDRGLYFFSKATDLGKNYERFNWSKVEVKGVGHSYTQMAANAAGLLY